MTPENPQDPGSDRTGEDREDLAAELLWKYLDRLNAGEAVDLEKIEREHPEIAAELIEQLEAFRVLGSGDEDATGEPVGTLGDYTLHRQIGRGGMGVVYEAWQNSMNRQVALKVLPAGIAADRRACTRFMREAQTAGLLNHQNVVKVYSTGVEEGTPWYSMEFVEGETLAQILTRIERANDDTETPFGAKKGEQELFLRLARAFADVADGLQHAHAKGVVHRDIKPSNLILDGNGQLRILDFGLARLEGQEPLTLTGDLVGTPLYMSPEQARRRSIHVDHRTDVYSLGATMYEAICGRPPFRGKDHADTLSQIIDKDVVEPRRVNPRVPKDLETIVLKCLRKDAEDRYGTAEALGQDLRRFVRNDPIEARPLSRWEHVAERFARHRARYLAAAVALALLVACGGLAWLLAAERRKTAERDYRTTVVAQAMELLRSEVLLTQEDPNSPYDLPLIPNTYRDLLSSNGRAVVERAVSELDRATEALPDRFEGHYYRAQGLRLLGQTASAIQELDLVIALRPSFAPARALLAEIRGEKSLVAAPGDDSWTKAWLGARRATLNRKWNAASAAFGELIELEEARGEGLFLGSALEHRLRRGIALLHAGKTEDAKLDFQSAYALTRAMGSEFVEPLLLLGKVYYLTDDPQRAERYLESALQRFSDRDDAELWVAAVYTSLAAKFERSYQHANAIAMAEKAIALHADDGEAYLRLGWALFRRLWARGEAERASPERERLLAAAEAAVSLSPDDSNAYILLSKVLQARGDHAKSRAAYRQAMEVRRENRSRRRAKDAESESAPRSGAEPAPTAVMWSTGARGLEAIEGRFEVCSALGAVVNSPHFEGDPSVTEDGRILCFDSDRDGTFRAYEAWRTNPDEPFVSVRGIDELNEQFPAVLNPKISADGKALHFGPATGPFRFGNVYIATREEVWLDDGRPAPFSHWELVEELSSPDAIDASPTMTRDRRTLVFHRAWVDAEGVGRRDLLEVWRDSSGASVGNQRLIEELNTDRDESHPSISADGLTVLFGGLYMPERGGGESLGLWWASRNRRWDDEGKPFPFDPESDVLLPGCVNTEVHEFMPFLSPDWPADGAKLYFARCYPGTCREAGDWDIFEATWRVKSLKHR